MNKEQLEEFARAISHEDGAMTCEDVNILLVGMCDDYEENCWLHLARAILDQL